MLIIDYLVSQSTKWAVIMWSTGGKASLFMQQHSDTRQFKNVLQIKK